MAGSTSYRASAIFTAEATARAARAGAPARQYLDSVRDAGRYDGPLGSSSPSKPSFYSARDPIPSRLM